MSSRTQYLTLLAAAAGFLLLVLAYLPGAAAPFYLDDWNNIVFNVGVHFDNLLDWGRLQDLPAEAGGMRKIAYLTFGVNWALTGGSPSAMRWANILIHFLNAVLAFLLFTKVLNNTSRMADGRSRLVAGAGAMMWALHPIQVSSVTYVVQRMNLLAACFTLLGTLAFLRFLDVPGRLRSLPALASLEPKVCLRSWKCRFSISAFFRALPKALSRFLLLILVPFSEGKTRSVWGCLGLVLAFRISSAVEVRGMIFVCPVLD